MPSVHGTRRKVSISFFVRTGRTSMAGSMALRAIAMRAGRVPTTRRGVERTRVVATRVRMLFVRPFDGPQGNRQSPEDQLSHARRARRARASPGPRLARAEDLREARRAERGARALHPPRRPAVCERIAAPRPLPTQDPQGHGGEGAPND